MPLKISLEALHLQTKTATLHSLNKAFREMGNLYLPCAGLISAATSLWSSAHSPGTPGSLSAAGMVADLVPNMSRAVSPVPSMSLCRDIGTSKSCTWSGHSSARGDQCPSPHLSLLLLWAVGTGWMPVGYCQSRLKHWKWLHNNHLQGAMN